MNFMLFSLDTLRADRLGCYGYGRVTSPHLDRIAAEGALCRSHFSPHIPTYPGHTTMLTGRDVYAHQITGQSGAYELSTDIPTLAEMLAANGYFTAAADNLGRWFRRGFEVYEGYEWDSSEPREWRKGEAVTSAALNVINRAAAQNKPFFAFVHYWDPHTPYLPPRPFDRMFYEADERAPGNASMDAVWDCGAFKWYFREWMPGVTDIEFPKAQYDAEVAYMDTCLAHVLARIEELGLAQDTMLIFTSDHGEELDEHGCWFDHHGLYDTNTRIPLIAKLRGVIPAGTQVGGLTQMTDIVPTVLDYAGLLDAYAPFGGCSLRRLFEAGGETASAGTCDAVHMTENTWMKKRALRTAEWKLIRALEPDLHGFPPVELYRVADDPLEARNLVEQFPEVVGELTAIMEAHVAFRTAETGLPDPITLQPVPLKRVGRIVADAAPTAPGGPGAPVAVGVGQGDEKLPEGDFVGYVRDEGEHV